MQAHAAAQIRVPVGRTAHVTTEPLRVSTKAPRPPEYLEGAPQES